MNLINKRPLLYVKIYYIKKLDEVDSSPTIQLRNNNVCYDICMFFSLLLTNYYNKQICMKFVTKKTILPKTRHRIFYTTEKRAKQLAVVNMFLTLQKF